MFRAKEQLVNIFFGEKMGSRLMTHLEMSSIDIVKVAF